jgi:antitoxin (DNA-binding transcriptional repressor) of toxin-antitoxin stability system
VRESGAFEANSKFGQLLDWVEAGEWVAFARLCKTVAHLTAPGGAFNAAVPRICARRSGVTLGRAKIAPNS